MKNPSRGGGESRELSLTLAAIERFRQLGSKCPGHPEYREHVVAAARAQLGRSAG